MALAKGLVRRDLGSNPAVRTMENLIYTQESTMVLPVAKVEEMKVIAQKFVDKVDNGKAKSKDTYADMKRLLDILK